MTVLIGTVLTIRLGPPSAEGLGRLISTAVFPYLVTAGLASWKPPLRRWGWVIGVFVTAFLVLNALSGLGGLAVDVQG